MEATPATPAPAAAPAAPAASPAPANAATTADASASSAPPATSEAAAASGGANPSGETQGITPAKIEGAVEKKDEPTKPSYDWKKWDGKLESIPEELRPQYEPVIKYFSPKLTQLEQIQAERDRVQSLYDLMLEGRGEDPRIAEMTTQQEELQREMEALRLTNKQLSEFREQQLNQQRETYWTDFQKEFPELVSDAKEHAPKRDQFLKLVKNDSWDPVVAGKLVRLGDEAIKLATEARQKGATDEVALELAELKVPKQPQVKDRAADALVVGSETPAAPRPKVQRGGGSRLSSKERLSQALDRSMGNG